MMRPLWLVAPATLFLACTAGDDEPSEIAASLGVGQGHAAVCPGPAGPGNGRCHARVVVDRGGEPLASSGPTGLNPADLRDAYKITGTGSDSTIIAIVDAFDYPSAE